jgi:1-acyl-sn-glycerol-3-phosphate acyltransferase
MYYFLNYIAWLLVKVTLRFQRQGLENIPAQGPLLVVANHMSVSDPILIGLGLKRRVVFLAKEELFKNAFSAFFVNRFGAIPVYRGRLNREALTQTRAVLAAGGVIGLFPEGQRSRTGALIAAQPGCALIAGHNRVTILPVGLSGTETIRGLGWVFHRPRVSLNIGRPFHLPVAADALNHEQLDLYSDLIMHKIAELLPEKYHGVYSNEEQRDERSNHQT